MTVHALELTPGVSSRNAATNRVASPEPEESAAAVLRGLARGDVVSAQAVWALQTACGLPATGLVTSAEVSVALHHAGAMLDVEEAARAARLARPSTGVAWPALGLGAAGPVVEVAQRALGVRGDVLGRLGPDTAAALLSLQAAEGLPMTGRLDAPTWDALLPALPVDPRDLDEGWREVTARLLGRCGAVCAHGLGGLLSGLDRLQRAVGLPREPLLRRATWTTLLAGDPDAVGAVVMAMATPFSRDGALDAVDTAISGLDPLAAAVVGPVLRQAAWSVGGDAAESGALLGAGYWSPEVERAAGGRAPWSALALGDWLREGTRVDLERHLFGRRIGAAAQLLDWGRRRAVVAPGDAGACAGDVALIGPRGGAPDRAALVVADLGRRVHTIEADVYGRVVERARDKATLVGLVRWWRWVLA